MKHNSTTFIMIAGIFVVLAIVLIGCGGGGGSSYGGGGTTTTTTTVQAVACPASGTTDVAIVNMVTGFNPGSVSVPVNTIVKWTNTDTTTHTVTSTTVPLYGTFDMQVSPSASVCLKFTTAGTFNYHCTLHPTMPVGVVIVQ
jgi:plastocyanin